MTDKLDIKIQQARAQVEGKQREIEQQNKAQRDLEAAQKELEALEAARPAYEAAKKKKLADFAKIEAAQEKNIMQTLKILDSAWDAALLEVIAARDAAAMDEDRDMPKYYTLFGGNHFGSIENILANIELQETALFEKAKIRSRVERYKLAMEKNINAGGYQYYK